MIYQWPTQRACTKDLPAHGLVSTVVPNVKSSSTVKKKRKKCKKNNNTTIIYQILMCSIVNYHRYEWWLNPHVVALSDNTPVMKTVTQIYALFK
jgi:hypothetical protein